MKKLCIILFVLIIKLVTARTFPNNLSGYLAGSTIANDQSCFNNFANGPAMNNQISAGNNWLYRNLDGTNFPSVFGNAAIVGNRFDTNGAIGNLGLQETIINNVPDVFLNNNLLSNPLTNINGGLDTSIANEVTYVPNNVIRPKSMNLRIGHPHNNCKENIHFHIVANHLEVNGNVAVKGKLPFNSVVTLNGKIPTVGKGKVNYGCGSFQSSSNNARF